MTNKILHFQELLEQHQFYEAHEVLEEVWFPRRFEQDCEIKLLKGFINAAVSFELVKRGRKKQSNKVWANYLKYRQYLYKVSSPYLKNYHALARYIESFHNRYSLNTH